MMMMMYRALCFAAAIEGKNWDMPRLGWTHVPVLALNHSSTAKHLSMIAQEKQLSPLPSFSRHF
jgi:hypothetical protein